MAGQRQLVRILDIKAENGQLALLGDLAVLLPQRTRRRVARIGKQRLFVQLEFGVERIEHRLFHIHLATHN